MRRTLTLLALAVALVACGDDDSTSEPVPLPAGWQQVVGPGFTLGLPAQWIAIDLTVPGQLDAVAGDLAFSAPDLGALIFNQGTAFATAGGLMLAVDLSSSSDTFATNMTVLRNDAASQSLEELQTQVPARLDLEGFDVSTSQIVELSGAPALVVNFTATDATQGTVRTVQYFFDVGDAIYLATFTSNDDRIAESVFPAVAETFRFG